MKTQRVCSVNLRHVKQEKFFACENASWSRKSLGSRMVAYAWLAALRELESITVEELRPLFGRTLCRPLKVRPQGGRSKVNYDSKGQCALLVRKGS